MRQFSHPVLPSNQCMKFASFFEVKYSHTTYLGCIRTFPVSSVIVQTRCDLLRLIKISC